LIPDAWFATGCGVFLVVPNLFLWLRVRTAIRLREKREIAVGKAEDHREHLLVYLFAMLLPFYSVNISEWRELGAALLFWHLNLHYMNLIFALGGYRVFTLYPPGDGNKLSGKDAFVLITRRVSVTGLESLAAYRLSDTVFLEGIE
jgi:hypothetical protein